MSQPAEASGDGISMFGWSSGIPAPSAGVRKKKERKMNDAGSHSQYSHFNESSIEQTLLDSV